MAHEGSTAVLRAIAVGLILFALLLAYGSFRDIRRARAAESWPTAEGVVTVSRPRIAPRFVYEYEVDDRRYTSQQVGFVLTPLYRATREYTTGDRIAVRFDRADPGTAVIRWGVPVAALLGELVAPLILLGIGGYGLMLSFAGLKLSSAPVNHV